MKKYKEYAGFKLGEIVKILAKPHVGQGEIVEIVGFSEHRQNRNIIFIEVQNEKNRYYCTDFQLTRDLTEEEQKEAERLRLISISKKYNL